MYVTNSKYIVKVKHVAFSITWLVFRMELERWITSVIAQQLTSLKLRRVAVRLAELVHALHQLPGAKRVHKAERAAPAGREAQAEHGANVALAL